MALLDGNWKLEAQDRGSWVRFGGDVVCPAGEVYKLNNFGQRVMEAFGSGVCPAGNYINLKCQGVMETFGHDVVPPAGELYQLNREEDTGNVWA